MVVSQSVIKKLLSTYHYKKGKLVVSVQPVKSLGLGQVCHS
jgi:hypothetical protein